MPSYLASNGASNIPEYFSYPNPWPIIPFLSIMMFFPPPSTRQLSNSPKLCSDAVSESSSTTHPPILIAITTPPASIISLDSEIIIIPPPLVYGCGHQRSWTSPSPYPNRVCNCDHHAYPSYYMSTRLPNPSSNSASYLAPHSTSNSNPSASESSINWWTVSFDEIMIERSGLINNETIINETIYAQPRLEQQWLAKLYIKNVIPLHPSPFNAIVTPPLLPTIRPFVPSHDATHSSGTHPSGIKIDAIPGRPNATTPIRTLIKGEHRGSRYESRGYGHPPTLTVGMVLLVYLLI